MDSQIPNSAFSQSYGFSSSHVWIWGLDYKENWAPKNWCFWTVVLEKTLESPLDRKEINPKGNQSWIFIGRTEAEAETPILWPPEAKNWLIGKDPDAGKDWRKEEKGTTDDEMVGWHHRLSGCQFQQASGVSDGQGGLACCSLWGHKESDTNERLNGLNWILHMCSNFRTKGLSLMFFSMTPWILKISNSFWADACKIQLDWTINSDTFLSRVDDGTFINMKGNPSRQQCS